MTNARERLHQLVDALPEGTLEVAEAALRRSAQASRGHVEHVGMWVADLDRAREFYERWFGARAGMRYSSTRRPLQTHFLSFEDGARLEVMTSPEESARIAHTAIALGSREAVDRLVDQMSAEGVRVLSPPRQTGDGYYEAVVADSEGNLIELIS